MKPRCSCLIPVALLTMTLVGAQASAQTAAKPKESASAVQRMAENLRRSGFKGLGELSAPQASIPRRTSFYERVLILGGDGGSHCVIPQGSVLHLPEHLSARILEQPQGRLISWEEMLRQSRSWLGTQEVNLEAARGKSKEVDALAAQLAPERRIMIAVNKGRPIPILQPAPQTAEPAATKTDAR